MVLFEADHRPHLPNLVARACAMYQRHPSIYAADALTWALYRTCHLPLATCHLPLATCHLPLATRYLPPSVKLTGQ
jgi:hypothetical protein